MSEFEKELTTLINMHSQENGSDTPDFILATFLNECLLAFNKASRRRKWHSDVPADVSSATKPGDLW